MPPASRWSKAIEQRDRTARRSQVAERSARRPAEARRHSRRSGRRRSDRRPARIPAGPRLRHQRRAERRIRRSSPIAATSLETELGRAVDRAIGLRRNAGRARARGTTICSPAASMLFSTRGVAARRRRRGARVSWTTAAGSRAGRDRRHRRSRRAAGARRRSRRADRRRRTVVAEADRGGRGPVSPFCVLVATSMLLAIDVGNTNIVLGVFDGDDARPELAAADAARADGRRARPAGRRPVRAQRDRHAQDRRRDSRLGRAAADDDACGRWCSATSASRRSSSIRRRHRHADPLRQPGGSRRRSHRQRGRRVRAVRRAAAARPLIVVDFGTATTFDAITAQGEYLGGAICPGVQISADALFQRAARLPRIDVRKPPHGRRAHDGRRDGVGAVLRLRRDGRRAGAPDERRARRQRAVRRHRRARDGHRAGDRRSSSMSIRI